MYCYQHRRKSYRCISIMFWAFPYLLLQAFGNISGFFVGVILAVVLTLMLNSLLRSREQSTPLSTVQQSQPLQETEREPYQRGYRAEKGASHSQPKIYQAQEMQPQYEEMQVPYPQELPPMEQ